MAENLLTPAGAEVRVTWDAVAQSLNRPYRVTVPMVALVAMVPGYLALAERARGSAVHTLEWPVDWLVPLVPAWALVYGSLYLFLIVLPVLVVRQEDLIRRTVWAYLTVWTAAYLCFFFYPTAAPRPATLVGNGFAAWGLRFLYEADPPFNCFPSLHVAHSFVSALACYRVQRRFGVFTLACALLVAISTLFTKQHYAADVVGGIALALGAYAVFLRSASRTQVPDLDRRLAPALALCAGGVVCLGAACYWVAYVLTGVA